MSMLNGYPMVNQNTPITSDGRPSENASEDCVAASICSMCMYLNGIKQVDHDKYNPDKFKDMAYNEALRNSGTAAIKYVDYCKSLGIKLWSVDGENAALIQEAHAYLAKGLPVMFTQDDWIVDTSLPQYAGWSHVAVWYADSPGTLVSMDPWGGFPRAKSDATWVSLMRFNQIWIAERIEETVIIDLNTPGVSGWFEALNDHQWKCKSNGKIVQYGLLSAYRAWGNSALCGLTYLGLPASNEIPLPGVPGAVKQHFERGVLIYDPGHKVDNPPGAGSVYAAHLYDGPGVDPRVVDLTAKVADLEKQLAVNPGNPSVQQQLDAANQKLAQVKAIVG